MYTEKQANARHLSYFLILIDLRKKWRERTYYFRDRYDRQKLARRAARESLIPFTIIRKSSAVRKFLAYTTAVLYRAVR